MVLGICLLRCILVTFCDHKKSRNKNIRKISRIFLSTQVSPPPNFKYLPMATCEMSYYMHAESVQRVQPGVERCETPGKDYNSNKHAESAQGNMANEMLCVLSMHPFRVRIMLNSFTRGCALRANPGLYSCTHSGCL